jgi:hypothetical protein
LGLSHPFGWSRDIVVYNTNFLWYNVIILVFQLQGEFFMAKTMQQTSGKGYAYPSLYGSHASMVIEDKDTKVEENEVICKDEFGTYTTEKNRLDNGLADPNRYRVSRLSLLFAGGKSKD